MDPQLRQKSKKSEIFGPNVADKYASAITKYLGLGCNIWPCPADYFLSTNPSFVIEPIEKVKTKSASFRKKRCGSLDWNCCFDYNWMGNRAQRVEYS